MYVCMYVCEYFYVKHWFFRITGRWVGFHWSLPRRVTGEESSYIHIYIHTVHTYIHIEYHFLTYYYYCLPSSYWSLLQKIRDSPPPSLPEDGWVLSIIQHTYIHTYMPVLTSYIMDCIMQALFEGDARLYRLLPSQQSRRQAFLPTITKVCMYVCMYVCIVSY